VLDDMWQLVTFVTWVDIKISQTL